MEASSAAVQILPPIPKPLYIRPLGFLRVRRRAGDDDRKSREDRRACRGKTIQRAKHDKTRDVLERIDELDAVGQLSVPRPSRILIGERPAIYAGPSPSGELQPGVGNDHDLWFVVLDDVVLKCQRTGVTSLPRWGAYYSKIKLTPAEREGKNTSSTTGQRNPQVEPRNLYKFLMVRCPIYILFGASTDELSRSRHGTLTNSLNVLLQFMSMLLP